MSTPRYRRGIALDTIVELTPNAGVLIDGLRIKDGGASSAASTTIGVSASSGAAVTTTIDAANGGAGTATTRVTADDAVVIGGGGKTPTVDFAGPGPITHSGNPPINFGTGQLSVALSNFASDAAAAGGGVPVGGLYRNGSVVQVRVT